MKRKLLPLLLALAMCLTLLPTLAVAAENDIDLTSTPISIPATYATWEESTKTLTLRSGYSFGTIILPDDSDVTIKTEGSVMVETIRSYATTIYNLILDNVNITVENINWMHNDSSVTNNGIVMNGGYLKVTGTAGEGICAGSITLNGGATIVLQDANISTNFESNLSTLPSYCPETGYTIGSMPGTETPTRYLLDASGQVVTRLTLQQYCTVTFDADGGTLAAGTVTPQRVAYNSTVNKPTDPIRGGYSFVGWYWGSGESDKAFTTGSTYTVTNDTILKAKWTLSPATATVTAKTGLVYNGTPRELVSVSNVQGGTVYYSLTGEVGSYSAAIPTATEAGTYHVWYYVINAEGYFEVKEVGPIVIANAPSLPPADDHGHTHKKINHSIEDTAESPKTLDPGTTVYAAAALLSYTGTALVVRGRKRK